MDENMTKEEYREEELRDAMHESNLYDWDYYWNSEVTKREYEAIKVVVELLRRTAKYHDNIGFSELEEMI